MNSNQESIGQKEKYDFDVIKEYQFPASLSVHLRHQNKWTAGFTEKVLEEYLRFIYLTAISETEIKPSQIIASVWKVHYTLDSECWQEIIPCLPKEKYSDPYEDVVLHHIRYEQQYEETLQFYRQKFGESPSNDIWGRLIFSEIRKNVEDQNKPYDKASKEGVAIMMVVCLVFIFPAIILWKVYGLIVGFPALAIAIFICHAIYKLMNGEYGDDDSLRRRGGGSSYINFGGSDDYSYSDNSSDSGGGGSDGGGGGGE